MSVLKYTFPPIYEGRSKNKYHFPIIFLFLIIFNNTLYHRYFDIYTIQWNMNNSCDATVLHNTVATATAVGCMRGSNTLWYFSHIVSLKYNLSKTIQPPQKVHSTSIHDPTPFQSTFYWTCWSQCIFLINQPISVTLISSHMMTVFSSLSMAVFTSRVF